MDPDNSRYVRTEEWRKERVKIIRFIVNQQMATLTYEDLAQHTRAVFHERYHFMSDERLLEVFEKENGIITEDMIKHRPGYEKRLGET
jgi:hypothetical protein